MSRLPTPAGDADVWGDILNSYLLVEHNVDGSHRVAVNPDATTSSKGKVRLAGDLSGTADAPVIAASVVTGAKIATATVTGANIAGTTITDANISATAAIVKSKLAALGIVDADVSAISESKITGLAADLAAKMDASLAIRKGDLYRNVKDYGATGDGVTDDTAAIQSTLTALPEGHVLYFPAGVYLVSSTLTIGRNQTIQGVHAPRWAYDSGSPSVIQATAGFSGTCIIHAPDMEQAGYSAENDGGRILRIAIDGANVGSNVHGILFEGQCRDWTLSDVAVSNVTGSGIRATSYTRTIGGAVHCKGFAFSSVAVYFAHGNGYSFNNVTDAIFFDCLAVSCFANGFYITGAGENQYSCCRAVFNGAHGFQYDGDHTGSVFSTCTTDRNQHNGFYITATGSYPVVLYGFQSRRDGRNNNVGGGGYAGVKVAGTAGGASNLTCPVWLAGCIQATGVNDDDTGANSPQYGVQAAYCSFLYVDGLLWGDTAAYNDAGNNTAIRFGGNTYYTTGTPGNPTRDTTTRLPLAPESLTFRAGAETWTAQPAALTEYLGGTSRRLKQDLTNMNQARLQVSLTTAANAGATLALQYSSDGGTNWFYLDNTSGPSCTISSTGLAVSGWVNLTAGAKADVLLRLVGAGGNAVINPVFVTVMAQIKP